MDGKLKEQIINEKTLKCYLISARELFDSLKIDGSIIFDNQSYELFEDIDKKTVSLSNYYIKKANADGSVDAKIYLIYYGDLIIESDVSINDFAIKHKDKIVGVAINADDKISYTLPYYEEGSFYFDFEKFLELLQKNNIACNLQHLDKKDEFGITAKLTPKNYY